MVGRSSVGRGTAITEPAAGVSRLNRDAQRVGLAVHGSVLVVGPDGAGKSAIADALTSAASDRGVPVLRAHWRPRTLLRGASDTVVTEPHSKKPRSVIVSFVKVGVMALDYALGAAGPWRRARLKGLLVFERGWWDQVVDSRRYRIPPTVTPLVRVLGRILPRADVVLVLRGDPLAIAKRKNELPASEIARQQGEWQRLAHRAGRVVVELDSVNQTLEQTTASAELAIRSALDSDQVWRRSLLAPRRLDLRTLGSAGAVPALTVYRTSKARAHAAARMNQTLVSNRVGAMVPSPIEDLAGLAQLIGVHVDGAAAFRSAPQRRWVVGIASGGRLHTVLKVGPSSDPALTREAEVLRRFSGLAVPFRVPTLRWTGDWRGQVVIATEAVPAGRRNLRIDLRDLVDIATALVQGVRGSGPIVHGDFASWNLLGTSGSFTLIDWESCRDAFDPMVDLVHFIVQDAALLGRFKADDALAHLLGAGSAGQEYCRRIGIESEASRELVRSALERETQSPVVQAMLEQLR